MNVKILLTVVLASTLTACVSASFYPETLPHACLNQPYETKVIIDGGMVVSSD